MQARLAPRRFVAALWAVAWLVVAGGTDAQAQAPAGEGATLDVRAVKFATVRAPGGGATWTEAVVELGITPSTDGGAYARWADNVRVTLSLGVRKRSGDYEFFRASAEAVALEAGRASIRFYLPPEIARREQLGSVEPYAWLVELTVKGKAVTPVPGHASTVLASPEALRSFKDRVARSSTLNDGVLVPQAESPFAAAYADETPSWVRR